MLASHLAPTFLALTLLAHSAAADVFVTSDGNDLTGDGSSAAPWRSITHALTQIPPVETIRLGPGAYRESTGEVFPLAVPCGVSIVALENPETTRIAAPVDPLDPRTLIEIVPGSVEGAATLLRGIELEQASIGLEITVNGSGPPIEVAVDDVHFNRTAQYGLRSTVVGGATLDLELRDVRTTLLANAVRVRVSRGSANLAVHRSFIDGLVTGIDLRALGNPGVSSIFANLGTIISRGSNTNGLRCQVTDGNTIATFVRDSVFTDHTNCLGTPVPNTGAIGDWGPAGGLIKHDIARTVFQLNGLACPVGGGSYDLPTYRPNDYTLADNLYGWPGVPGGTLTGDPGFVELGDYHLRPNAIALDGGAFGTGPDLWGDLDSEFGPQDPTSILFEPGLATGTACFPGPADIGPDERREVAVYAFPPLQVGEGSALRVLGPPSMPSDTPLLAAAVFVASDAPLVDPCLDAPAPIAGAVLFGAGFLDPDGGRLDLPVLIPDLASWAGRTFAVQAVLLDPVDGNLRWTSVRRERVRR